MNVALSLIAAAVALYVLPATSVRQNTIADNPPTRADIDTIANPSASRFPGVFVTDEHGVVTPLHITSLVASVRILGTIATTTLDITVFNPHQRVLEGEFSFPIATGETVSRFALDIDGRLREAVVVSKTKGRQTFESVIRTKADPALLEWTRDNCFRARIYPLPARGTRRIVVSYEQQLTSTPDGFAYTFPFAFPQPIDQFSFQAIVSGSATKPSLTGPSVQSIEFSPEGRDFTMEFEEANVLLKSPFTIGVPVALNQHYVSVQHHEDQLYAGVFLRLAPESIRRENPKSVAVYWDASLSALHRDIRSEIDFLMSYLEQTKPLSVQLTVFAHQVISSQTYAANQFNALRYTLQNLQPDGATQLNCLPFANATANEILLFSDGITTFGDTYPQEFARPVIAVTSSVPADNDVVNFIAESSGGRHVDLSTANIDRALSESRLVPLSIQSIKVISGDVDSLLPTGRIPIDESTVITGKLRSATATLRITTTSANSNEQWFDVQIRAVDDSTSGNSIPRLWASQELRRLNANRSVNAAAIMSLGMRFGIVTPGTSLLVLEQLADYVRYAIPPPRSEPEMLRAYFKEVSNAQEAEIQATARHRSMVASLLRTEQQRPAKRTDPSSIWIWPVTQQFPTGFSSDQAVTIQGTVMDRQKKPIPNARVCTPNGKVVANTNANGAFTIKDVIPGKSTIHVEADGYDRVQSVVNIAPASTQNVAIVLSKQTSVRNKSSLQLSTWQDNSAAGDAETSVAAEPLSNNIATNSVQVAEDAGADGTYAMGGAMEISSALVGRRQNPPASPSVSVADVRGSRTPRQPEWMADSVQLEKPASRLLPTREAWTVAFSQAPTHSLYACYLALRPNYYTLPGFYLDASDELIKRGKREDALRVLTCLAELMGEDSRSLRILAHRLLQLGYPNLAVTVFTDVLRVRDEEPQSYRDLGLALAACKKYNEAAKQFTYVLEHPWDNRFPEVELIAARELSRLVHQADERIHIEPDYRVPYISDLRVVLTWDADNCDMDLWVTDPDGEVCMYNHRYTTMGGRMSKDLTGGYGPEEFVLTTAKKGTYKVQVHYYGSRQQDLLRPTTVQVGLFAGYGTSTEKHEAVTLRVDGVKKLLDIGSIIVN